MHTVTPARNTPPAPRARARRPRLALALLALAAPACSSPYLADAGVDAGDAFAADGPAADGASDAGPRADATALDAGADAGPVCRNGFCEPVAEVSAGAFATCVRRADGTVACAGSNAQGELGDGTTTSSASYVPVAGLADAVQVNAGERHACAVLRDGTVKCWGLNFSGELGDGTRNNHPGPVTVPGLAGVAKIATGATFSCALMTDGTVKCWGSNFAGQLGDMYAARYQLSPTEPVAGLAGATDLVLGPEHACALLGNGTVKCWGDNGLRQLGVDNLPASAEAIAVPGLADAVQISTGRNHSCAVRRDGSLWCWGASFHGETGGRGVTPAAVPGITDAAVVACGASHTCVALRNGNVECFGWNGYGQLGDGTTAESSSPVAVRQLSGVVALSAGAGYTCARLAAGTLECWGRNEDGQFGDGTTRSRRYPGDPGMTPGGGDGGVGNGGDGGAGLIPGVGFHPTAGTRSVYQCVFGNQCSYPMDLSADPTTVPGSTPRGWNFTGETHALYRRRYGPGSFGAIPQGMDNELYFANAEALRNAFRAGDLGSPAVYDGEPTQLETEDSKFTIPRNSGWYCTYWVAYGLGGSSSMPIVVMDSSRPPGPYTAPCQVWTRCTCYYDNQP